MRAALTALALMLATPAWAQDVQCTNCGESVPQPPIVNPYIEQYNDPSEHLPYGMTKEEFGAFIEEHVRKAMGTWNCPAPGCPYPYSDPSPLSAKTPASPR